jgi:hypothetical protein
LGIINPMVRSTTNKREESEREPGAALPSGARCYALSERFSFVLSPFNPRRKNKKKTKIAHCHSLPLPRFRYRRPHRTNSRIMHTCSPSSI